MINKSTLFIVNDINEALEELKPTLPIHSVRVIRNEEDGKNEFLLTHANKTIKEAYIATSDIKYIIICASLFRVEAQNSLLKVLEEPPKNIVFIMITTSKNSILPTILSRVSVQYQKTKKIVNPFQLDLIKLELKDLYSFLKQNQRITKNDAKDMVESIIYSINDNDIKLTQDELHSFSIAMKLLELNSKPINVLTTLLLMLIDKEI